MLMSFNFHSATRDAGLLPNLRVPVTNVGLVEKKSFNTQVVFPLNDGINWKLIVESAILGTGRD